MILFSLVIFLGLILTEKVGFKLPLIKAATGGRKIKETLREIGITPVLLGVVTAFVIYILDSLFTGVGVSLSTHQTYAPIWQKLLASFYGGITEEILMRLFLMSFFAFLGMKIMRQTTPSVINILVSIFLAAVIFGLGHLPITASLTTITPLVVLRAIALNGVGGIIFGLLFWKKGLESAIIAHFTADIFLLTLLPLLLG